MLGLDITEIAVCKFLKRLDLHTPQASYNVHVYIHMPSKGMTLHQQCHVHVAIYLRKTLLFVDKASTGRKDSIRKYGYSCREKPLKAQKLLVHGEHTWSCIAATSVEDVVAISSSVYDAFYNFVCTSLLALHQTLPSEKLKRKGESLVHFDHMLDMVCTATTNTDYGWLLNWKAVNCTTKVATIAWLTRSPKTTCC